MSRIGRKIMRANHGKKPICHKCSKEFGTRHELVERVEGGWMCPKCGYIRRLK